MSYSMFVKLFYTCFTKSLVYSLSMSMLNWYRYSWSVQGVCVRQDWPGLTDFQPIFSGYLRNRFCTILRPPLVCRIYSTLKLKIRIGKYTNLLMAILGNIQLDIRPWKHIRQIPQIKWSTFKTRINPRFILFFLCPPSST